jgi:hypothetical protein
MNASIFKIELGRYLLQDKYDNIQECTNIFNTLNDTKSDKRYQVAIVWNYDGYSDYTHFRIIFDKKVNKKYKDYLERRYRFKLKNGLYVKGFYQYLTT